MSIPKFAVECKPKVYPLVLKIKIGDGNFEMGLG
jgi:hypothetical protein